MELILLIDDSALRLAQFDNEISDDNVRTDSTFENATARSRDIEPKDAESHALELAIVDYLGVLERLHDALADLRNELAKSASRRPWRQLLPKTLG